MEYLDPKHSTQPQEIPYRELFRPQFHFSPKQYWTNDPAGLFYYKGEYHMFFQYNPKGNEWGHMSWGHAVSNDLVHWRELPVAIPENDVMIFTGSAVVDWNNTSGFRKSGEHPPIVAIYTGHKEGQKQIQDQRISYSLDAGTTWVNYENNPVLDLQLANFRDPKVFWHDPSNSWKMVVALPEDQKLHIYGSENLKSWHFLSTFIAEDLCGIADGPWECPNLFKIPIIADEDKSVTGFKWVMVISVTGKWRHHYGVGYFIGEFDGTSFKPDWVDLLMWADHGKDFYAPQAWSGIATSKEEPLWIGWHSYWPYAEKIPTSPWKGCHTLPRKLCLRYDRSGLLKLYQNVIEEVDQLRTEKWFSPEKSATEINQWFNSQEIPGCCLEIEILYEATDLTEAIDFSFYDKEEQAKGSFKLTHNLKDDTLSAKRCHSEYSKGIGEEYEQTDSEYLTSNKNKKFKLKMYIDKCSIEIFHQDGKEVFSELFFGFVNGVNMEITEKTSADLKTNFNVKIYKLKSIWN